MPVEKVLLSYKGDTTIPDSETLKAQGVENHDIFLILERNSSSPGGANPLSNIRNVSDILQQVLPNHRITPEQQRRQRMIDENYALAMQEAPESFASVYMLYIDVEINGHPVKAFIDSGAQSSVMSKDCAERTEIMDLVDPRFAGVAVGVGSARIMGKIHLAPVKVENTFYNCSFSVLSSIKNMDMLIGLDMLKKYQCSIDLKEDVLLFGTTGQKVKFLPERDLPAHARLH
eukprot:augustus_masked-scaffold_5-processed-gene-7.46-mRNA-1 protein AED:0.01 eAED:0.02 QI:0/-1/0/1/-1/1/1/0/230